MGSIEVRFEKSVRGKPKGPYAYYKKKGKGVKRLYLGKVPDYYVELFSPEIRELAKMRLEK